MNHRSDIDRVLQIWMADGPTAISDRVVDVVAARIGVQRQRRAWPFPGRTNVSNPMKLIAALAAALVVAVVGYNLLAKPEPGVGSSPSPVVTAPSTPSPTTVAIRDVQGNEPSLDPGRWRFRPLEDDPGLSVVADIPAGWLPLGNRGLENVSATNSPPSGLAMDFFQSEHGLFSDPCHWDVDGTGTPDQGDVEVGPTVADLVDALRANTSYTSSTPSPIAFGPYQGQQLELRLPADLDPATCDKPSDSDEGRYFVMPGTIYSQGPSNIWRMSIVDVAGTRFIVTIEYFPGTAPDKLAEAEAIVNSFEFTP
jgi:hypothetical protein